MLLTQELHLSQLLLNPENRDALRDLASPHEMHRTLMRGFPDQTEGGPGRVLYRIEPTAEGQPPTLLVQSDRAPDWSELPSRYGRVVAVKRFAPDPDDFLVGRRLRFRLVVNPTIKRQGKRYALCREEDYFAWLVRKAADSGFHVDPPAVRAVPLGRLRSKAAGGDREWFGVLFDGSLTTTDPVKLCETVRAGIGSGKAFGFGLLSLAPG